MAYVLWYKSTTAKVLCHVTMQENSTRESVHEKTISIHYVGGKCNTSDILTYDILTKEFGCDPLHFTNLHSANMSRVSTTLQLLITPMPSMTMAVAARSRPLVSPQNCLHYSFPATPCVYPSTANASSTFPPRTSCVLTSPSYLTYAPCYHISRLGGIT